MSTKERPHICSNPDCKILYSNFVRNQFDAGYSFDCWGQLPEENVLIAPTGGAEHRNDMCRCTWTPFKGLLRFLICKGDLWRDFVAISNVLDKVETLTCEECGPLSRLQDATVFHFHEPRQILCQRCAVRLGRMAWDEDKGRYI